VDDDNNIELHGVIENTIDTIDTIDTMGNTIEGNTIEPEDTSTEHQPQELAIEEPEDTLMVQRWQWYLNRLQ